MLIKSVQKVYRERFGQLRPERPVSAVGPRRSAANSDDFGNGEMQQRRFRRQRRLNRTTPYINHGWSLRTW